MKKNSFSSSWWIAPDDRVAQYTNDGKCSTLQKTSQIENSRTNVRFSSHTEFLLGENILVAPVLIQGMVSRDIYLPNGVWTDGNTGDTHTGPIWLYSYPANLSVLPYFTRANSSSSSTSVLQISEMSATMIALFALLFLSRL